MAGCEEQCVVIAPEMLGSQNPRKGAGRRACAPATPTNPEATKPQNRVQEGGAPPRSSATAALRLCSVVGAPVRRSSPGAIAALMGVGAMTGYAAGSGGGGVLVVSFATNRIAGGASGAAEPRPGPFAAPDAAAERVLGRRASLRAAHASPSANHFKVLQPTSRPPRLQRQWLLFEHHDFIVKCFSIVLVGCSTRGPASFRHITARLGKTRGGLGAGSQ